MLDSQVFGATPLPQPPWSVLSIAGEKPKIFVRLPSVFEHFPLQRLKVKVGRAREAVRRSTPAKLSSDVPGFFKGFGLAISISF